MSKKVQAPKGRVNLSVKVQTGDAIKAISLPQKMLVIADFGQGKDDSAIDERKKMLVNKKNIDKRMQELAPSLKVDVKTGNGENGLARGDQSVELKFNSMKDFNPDKIAEQVPSLKRLLATRHLLKELRTKVVENKELTKSLKKLFNEDAYNGKANVNKLLAELNELLVEKK